MVQLDRGFHGTSGFTAPVRLLLVAVIWVHNQPSFVLGQDQRCSPSIVHVNVTSAGGVLYSPGYPEDYHNSEVCTWVLRSAELGKVLQLHPLDMHLGGGRASKLELRLSGKVHEDDCSPDYLTAFDGDSTNAPQLHKWCHEQKAAVHSTTDAVTLQLRTNDRRRHKGFAVKYSALTLSDNKCENGFVKTIPLGEAAVVSHFTAPVWTYHSKLPSLCSWRLVADDVKRNIVVDLEEFDFEHGLPCRHGNLSIYDGTDSVASLELVRWCARSGKPFTSLYLSGSSALIVIRVLANVTTSMRFRFSTKPRIYESCSLTKIPVLELPKDHPVYVRFPFAVNESGYSCPVRFVSTTATVLWARVDLLEVEGERITSCPTTITSRLLTVLQANETTAADASIVPSTCWRGHHPVYWPIGESVILSPSQEGNITQLFVKVTPDEAGSCHGRIRKGAAPRHEALVIRNPVTGSRSLSYSPDVWCRYVISGEGELDHVLARVDAELCEMENVCNDYVKIYDGQSTKSPVLYDSDYRHAVSAHVISSGRYLTYEVSTDYRGNRGFITAEFNSVPVRDLCEDVKRLNASRKTSQLSSVNYPHYYPLNYMCQYCITAEDPNDVIYVKVIDSDLTYTCSDLVEVYDGSNSEEATTFLGKFCGHDTPSFVSRSPGLCLLFRSDPTLHGRGWRLTFRAGPPPDLKPDSVDLAWPTEEAATTRLAPEPASAGSDVIIVLAVLLGVTFLALVAVLVLCVLRARRSRAATVA